MLDKTVNFCWRWMCLLGVTGGILPWHAYGQIDPVKRDLVEAGYNAALEGHPPLAAYAFYYHNDPGFWRTNTTLRLSVAPTYLDSELGISHALSEHTDVGIGVAGGGFADSYNEVDQGTFYPSQSFIGHSAETSLSVYHLFNPGQRVPLYGVVRGRAHYSDYVRADRTAPDFELPKDRGTFSVRAGLRWGGRAPLLLPAMAMEVSAWYQGSYRTGTGTYGYGDYTVERETHSFWGRALLDYTLPEWKHRFSVSLTAGTTLNADRFSAYRLGADLPLSAEFPLSLPGYYSQEFSAKQFLLVEWSYTLPLDRHQHWNLVATMATAGIDYLPGLEQPGDWNTGVGGGLLYDSHVWKLMVGYAYGADAIRSHGRGGSSINVLFQLDIGKAKERWFDGD